MNFEKRKQRLALSWDPTELPDQNSKQKTSSQTVYITGVPGAGKTFTHLLTLCIRYYITEKMQGKVLEVKNENGELATDSNTELISLFHMHTQASPNELESQSAPLQKKSKLGMMRNESGRTLGRSSSFKMENLKPDHNHIQILLSLKMAMVSVGEKTELFFSLYKEGQGYLTHEFEVKLGPQGLPEDVSAIYKQQTILRDINQQDCESKLYLVCRMVRVGRMFNDTTKNKGKSSDVYRRPFGCGVIELTSLGINKKEDEIEKVIEIYTTLNENQFQTLPESIIKSANPGKELGQIAKAKGISIGLKPYYGPYDNVISQNDDLAQIYFTSKLQISDPLPKLNFFRNDFFITLDKATFSNDKKNRNIEILITVCDSSGNIIPDSIWTSNCKLCSSINSTVIFHNNSPIWGETFSFNLPKDQILLQKYHIHFLIKHCHEKGKDREIFCQTAIKLTTEDKTIINDQQYTLNCFKTQKLLGDSAIDTFKRDPTIYLLPLEGEDNGLSSPNIRKSENIKITTKLSSTCLTQNESLFNLLHWNDFPAKMTVDIMDRVIKFISPFELSKSLERTLDSIFNILKERSDYSESVFEAFVNLITILVDEKSQNSQLNKKALDDYLNNHFSKIENNKAHCYLISGLKNSLKKNMTPEKISKLLSTLKGIQYTFKFILISKKEDKSIDNELLETFELLNNLMGQSQGFRGPQNIAIKNLGSIFGSSPSLFDNKLTIQIIQKFICSISYEKSSELLNQEKLFFIQNIVSNSHLNQSSNSNNIIDILLPTILDQLTIHLNSEIKDEILQCLSILGLLFWQIKSNFPIKDSEKSFSLISKLLPNLFNSLYFLNNDVNNNSLEKNSYFQVLECATLILAILKEMSKKDYQDLLSSSPSVDQNLNLIRKSVEVLNLILGNKHIGNDNITEDSLGKNPLVEKNARTYTILDNGPYHTFPSNWISMIMSSFNIAFYSISQILNFFLENHLQLNYSNQNLIHQTCVSLLKFLILFIQNKKLSLLPEENIFSEFIQKNYSNNDIRISMKNLLIESWKNKSLGIYKRYLVSHLVSPLLSAILSKEKLVFDLSMNFYYDLFAIEFRTNQSISQIESETIETLVIFSDQVLTQEFIDNLTNGLQLKFQEESSQDSKIPWKEFISDLKFLMNLLFSAMKLPRDPCYEDDRIAVTVQLMYFLKKRSKKDAYFHHVHKLEAQHISSGNYAAAGFAVLLHADLLEWSDTVLEPLYKGITQRFRKEKLYKKAIEYFDKASLWEKAIQLSKILIQEFETGTFDYEKLSDMLKQQSTFVQSIFETERFYAKYFRVGFYGNFPPEIKNKSFIYRGRDIAGCLPEDRSAFTQRILERYPSAEVLTYTDAPPQQIKDDTEKAYLQIFLVECTTEEKMKGNAKVNRKIPPFVKDYYANNDASIYLYSKPDQRDKKDENEFKNLWLKNYYYICSHSLPNHLPKTEITETVLIELTPIQYAIGVVSSKNEEIFSQSRLYENGAHSNINPFTMNLSGVIDAAVNGGSSKFTEAFFTDNYLTANASHSDLITELRLLLDEQIELLQQGLSIHRKICDSSLLPLQQNLELQFDKMLIQMGNKKESDFGGLDEDDQNSQILDRKQSKGPGKPVGLGF